MSITNSYATKSPSQVLAAIAGPALLVPRLWLGYSWVRAATEKLSPAQRDAWLDGGAAVKGFVAGAVEAAQEPHHPQVAYDWWVEVLRWVDQNASVAGKLVVAGELLVGIALLVGAFTGIAAALGLGLNFTYLMSGSAGPNAAFILVGVLLVVARRYAGRIGADGLTHRFRTRSKPALAVPGPDPANRPVEREPVAVG